MLRCRKNTELYDNLPRPEKVDIKANRQQISTGELGGNIAKPADCMKKNVACLSASNWFKTISLLFLAGVVGLIAAESLPAVAGTTILGTAVGGTGGVGGTLFGGLRVGNLVRRFLPISEYKIRCWRRKLRGNLVELYKCSKDLISKDIKEIEDKVSEKLDHAKAEKLKKIQEEESKSLNLTTRSKELQESQTRLTEGNTEFDELLIE